MSEELKNAYYLLRATRWVRRSSFWEGLTRRNFELTHLAVGYDGYQTAMGSENFVAQTVQTGSRHFFFPHFRLTHLSSPATCCGPSLQRLAVGHFQQLTCS